MFLTLQNAHFLNDQNFNYKAVNKICVCSAMKNILGN